MKELQVNFQIVYFNQENTIDVAESLITFGYRQFLASNRLKEIALLKELCEAINSDKFNPKDERISKLAFEQLIDSIRISICFENFFKGLFLVKGYVIHQLDEKIFPTLSKEQLERPILLEEIKKTKKWEVNNKIKTKDSELKYQIKGILEDTIGLPILTHEKYLEGINFNAEIFNILKRDFDYRNNLPYDTSENFSIAKNDYEQFVKIIDYVNANIVRIQNELCTVLEKDAMDKVGKIEYL